MEEDIEIIKMKKLLSLRRSLLSSTPKVKEEDPREVVLKHLTGRGREILELAESQHPHVARVIVRELARLIKEGKLRGALDGYTLYQIFEELGYPIRVKTKIVIKGKGRAKSIAEALKESLND